MDARRYERSTYCAMHHAAGLDTVEVALMDLADKVAADATSVTEADGERLRSLGRPIENG